MSKIVFTNGNWEDKLVHAVSRRFKSMPEFKQEADCIVNGRNDDGAMGYDYITLMTKETYGPGTKVTAEVEFESYGAPLLVFSKDLTQDEDGTFRYGTFYEVVLWEEGINVWNLYMLNGKLEWELVLFEEMKIEPKTKCTFSVEIFDKYLSVAIEDRKFKVQTKELAPQVHIGITACESLNRLYSLEIEE